MRYPISPYRYPLRDYIGHLIPSFPTNQQYAYGSRLNTPGGDGLWVHRRSSSTSLARSTFREELEWAFPLKSRVEGLGFRVWVFRV